MAHHLASVRRLLQHGFFPELFWHRQQTQRGEKSVGFLEHSGGVPALNGKKKSEDVISEDVGVCMCVCINSFAGNNIFNIWKKQQLR